MEHLSWVLKSEEEFYGSLHRGPRLRKAVWKFGWLESCMPEEDLVPPY